MYSFVLAVALTEDGGIGKNNRLPWYPNTLSVDMCWFRRLTQGRFCVDGDKISLSPCKGNILVMGRKTWDSIPARFRPLPERLNVIMSRRKMQSMENTIFVSDFSELGKLYREYATESHMFVIGGHDIYDLAMKSGCVEFVFATEVACKTDCDTFFPDIDWRTYEKKDITKDVSELVDPELRNAHYMKDLNMFLEYNTRFKMFMYTRSRPAGA